VGEWPLRIRLWHRAHLIVNWLCWHLAPEAQPTGSAAPTHWLWRLNERVADHWIGWWIEQRPDAAEVLARISGRG